MLVTSIRIEVWYAEAAVLLSTKAKLLCGVCELAREETCSNKAAGAQEYLPAVDVGGKAVAIFMDRSGSCALLVGGLERSRVESENKSSGGLCECCAVEWGEGWFWDVRIGGQVGRTPARLQVVLLRRDGTL